MTPLKKLREQDTVRHIWGCVPGTHPHICRTDLSSLAFFSGLIHVICVIRCIRDDYFFEGGSGIKIEVPAL